MSDNFFVPFSERETTVNIDYANKNAQIYSSHPKTAEKLLEMAKIRTDEAVVDFCSGTGVQITVPMSWIRIKPPRKFSEKERTSRMQQLEKVRPSKEKSSADQQ